MRDKNNKAYKTKRNIFILVSVGIITILVLLATLFVWKWLASFSKEDFRDYILSFGSTSWLVLLGLQFLQVFVALIPGELLESTAGFIFGPWIGTLLCYIGITLASVLIFIMTKRFGVRLVEMFIPRERIYELRFINTERKLKRLIFLLFFIPGTPKDIFTYFAGLTRIKLTEFLAISMVARLPSLLTSTFGGYMLGEKRYIGAIIIYGVTAVVSICGMIIYNKIIKSKRKML